MGDIVDDYVTGNYTFEQLGEKYDTEIDLIYDTIINSDLPPDYSSQYEGQFLGEIRRHFETRVLQHGRRFSDPIFALGLGPESKSVFTISLRRLQAYISCRATC